MTSYNIRRTYMFLPHVAAFGLILASRCIAGPVFQGIGDLHGGLVLSRIQAVSDDGQTAVGTSVSEHGVEGFRWTAGGGIIGIGDLPGGEFLSEARDVSSDGTVIVGFSESARASVGEAFRWENGLMEGLGDFPGGPFASGANAVSPDGAIVVGGGNHATGGEAFLWRRETGLVALGDLPGGIIASNAFGVSASGGVVVGGSISETGTEAFRWTAKTGMVGLGFFEGGDTSFAEAVSSDGNVIVGTSDSEGGFLGFLWTELSGMISLGGPFRAVALSDDASIVVGSAFGQDALIWSNDQGLRSLQELLVSDFALDLTGWTLEAATDISADGRTIVGYGINPDGFTEGWIAVIPEPSTLALLASGLWPLRRRRRPGPQKANRSNSPV